MTDRQVPRETGGSVRLVGTAHISTDSVAEVEETIERERPDVVAVELDEGRYRQLQGELPDDLDAGDLLRGNTVFQFLAYWMLSYVQTRLGERFDIEPGADMRAAVETAQSLGLGVALVDREIQTTIQRFWARMTLVEKLKLVGGLFLGMFGYGSGEEEIDVEELTDADVVTAMMAEFRRFSPGGAEALIDERDAYIAHKLLALRNEGHDVIAVVGAGHREGIERYLADPASLPPMASLVGTQKGRRFSIYKAVGYLIALAFLAFFFLLVMAGAQNDFLLRVFAAWFLFNGVFAFSLAKLAGAHWPSATVGGAIAWMTSINPLLAPGWFAGYVELRYQRVNVADIGTLNEILADEESPIRDLLKRMLDVPLFRLIAVVAATNIGSIIATVLFPLVVLPWLAADIGGVGAVGDLMIEGARNSAELVWRALA
ncbi:TraB/GumN family protein [Halalkalicoccus sp. NIPERK01]|uniref:TraB/GumN family protein n=1 Tax=Halalkalicoccus sp. NIPERK01 TaxID=3053469 RepID=UPI00256EA5F0|nr:TraB/GumN family protein [Halalkalicoccus sp. NIPERK01]MDL5360532.1 TraB/GumN family protein [Halalkalicoccus sp. NIPERK01]